MSDARGRAAVLERPRGVGALVFDRHLGQAELFGQRLELHERRAALAQRAPLARLERIERRVAARLASFVRVDAETVPRQIERFAAGAAKRRPLRAVLGAAGFAPQKSFFHEKHPAPTER